MSQDLEKIRQEINAIDNGMHDLLMRRASLVDSIVASKKKGGIRTVQPAREAEVMQRLLARHSGTLPALTIFSMWRELFSASALLQSDLSVGISHEIDDQYFVRNYFGAKMPLEHGIDDEMLAQNILTDKNSFIVIPAGEAFLKSDFWPKFMMENADLRAVFAFPYLQKDDKTCFVLYKNEFKPSSQDSTVVLLCSENNDYSLKTFDGFLTEESSEIQDLKKTYTLRILGGYPVMPDIQ